MSSTTLGSIAVISWNVNGFKTRRADLEELIFEHSPDVLCLQETKTPSGCRLALLGYSAYRFDRDTRSGGVAILVKPGVDHCFLGTDSGVTMDNISIELSTATGPVKITSLYKSPQQLLERDDIQSLVGSDVPTIALGDLNCKSPAWNSRMANANGRRLEEWADDFGAVVVGPLEPSYIPYGRGLPDVLDIVKSSCKKQL
ncbi:exodeoxyribonuclease III-like [Aethina tumida]|uniref:exodeoxyribonuclease III-like n=1 Tax=Aethina tumida TaxID=116153 RepID=UPI002148F677|nr:exodeoxyribonuclease III-like [Aethina tumida]